jgi:hypothetical protein
LNTLAGLDTTTGSNITIEDEAQCGILICTFTFNPTPTYVEGSGRVTVDFSHSIAN